MNKLEKKSLTTKRGLEYAYYASPAAPGSTQNASKAETSLPALLFLHGFPDHALLWDEVVSGIQRAEEKMSLSLSASKFRVIAPDLLGYGGTSKDKAPALRDYSAVAQDLAEILAAEKVTKVIAIGHDWGSVVAQRFYLYQPSRVAGLILLSVPYMPPDVSPDAPLFDLEKANKAYKEIFGYASFEYWNFFTAPGSARLIRDNLQRFYEVMHGDEPDWMREMFCVEGAMEKYLRGEHPRGGLVKLKPYAEKEVWKQRYFSRFEALDSFESPLAEYVAFSQNVHAASTKTIPPERLKIQLPLLYIGSKGDAVCRPEGNKAPKDAGLLPDLEMHVLQGPGHWIPMEAPQEAATLIWSFLDRRFLQGVQSV